MTFRDRIHPQLRAWYDASPGFDFDNLEEFVPKCNAAELANLKEDPEVIARDKMIPGPDGAPDVKIRMSEWCEMVNGTDLTMDSAIHLAQ